jgi:NADPH2:quinone reductase
MLVTVANLRPSQDVLIVGVGGGVASAALQIASMAGARVFVCSGEDWKIERARVLGAEAGFNYREGPFSEWVLAQTDGRGVDVVVDPVGAATWPESIRSLARGGKLVICGATSGASPEIDIREIYQRHRQVLGAPMGNRRDFEAMLKAAFGRRIDPIIDRVLPLEAIREAHRAMEARETFGKVVIRVSG